MATTKEILVVVHLSWPFESRDDIPLPCRRQVLYRAGLILARLVDHMNCQPRPRLVLVGPFVVGGCGMPDHVGEYLRSLATTADFMLPGGLSDQALVEAGRAVLGRWPDAKRIRVAGFWRDVCCNSVARGLIFGSRGRVAVLRDRKLSSQAPDLRRFRDRLSDAATA